MDKRELNMAGIMSVQLLAMTYLYFLIFFFFSHKWWWILQINLPPY